MRPEIVLDVHAHLVPIVQERLAGLKGVRWNPASQTLAVDGHEIGIKSIYKPEALLDWMDEHGVQHAFVSAPPPLYRQHLRGAEARAWVSYVNEGLAAIVARYDGRLSLLVHLPIEEPELAMEIVAAATARGHTRFAMPTGTGDERTLGLPEFGPLWAALDRAHAFVFFHPGECADGRLKAHYLANLLGNPYESTVALAHLLFSGMLEQHTNIVPCFAHGGGLLPMVAGRFERGFDTKRPGVNTTRAAPSQLMSRFFVDCICHSEAAAVNAEQTFGADNVVFGSDWPFPMGILDPHDQLSRFDPRRRSRFLTVNPKRLLSCIAVRSDEGTAAIQPNEDVEGASKVAP